MLRSSSRSVMLRLRLSAGNLAMIATGWNDTRRLFDLPHTCIQDQLERPECGPCDLRMMSGRQAAPSRAQLSPGQVCGFPSPHPDQGLIHRLTKTELLAVVNLGSIPLGS